MLEPGIVSEHQNYLNYLTAQIAALRASAYGLTEQQARATPCRSTLSIGGLLKHAIFVMGAWDERTANPSGDVAPDFFTTHFGEYVGSFTLAQGQTLAALLDEFDTVATRYLEQVGAIDPGATVMEPPTPWTGRVQPSESSTRFLMVHHIEELGRHAGHADIVREQLDGAQAGELLAAQEGTPPNAFVQPWQPREEAPAT